MEYPNGSSISASRMNEVTNNMNSKAAGVSLYLTPRRICVSLVRPLSVRMYVPELEQMASKSPLQFTNRCVTGGLPHFALMNTV